MIKFDNATKYCWYNDSTPENAAHLTASTTQRSVRSSARRLSTLADDDGGDDDGDDDDDDEPSSAVAILCAAGNRSNSEN